jgi:large subunit ribosomal protein L2
MKTYNPTTKSRRQMTGIDYQNFLSLSRPLKSLVSGGKRAVGRNNRGRITMRHKGGGHKRLFRTVDFLYDKKDIPAVVETIEYDPNRTGFISRICYRDGERRYVLAPKGMKVGDTVLVSESAPIQVGNRLPLAKIPIGSFVYNVEIKPGNGAVLARSAGNYAEVVALEGGYANLKLPSSEVRKVPEKAWASIGVVSNEENRLVVIGKAGRSRWLGIRPTVRASAMNPRDHKYGGGEGRQGRGTRRAVTKWGKPVGKGQKSRKAKKYSNAFIVSRRQVGKRRPSS